MLLDGKPVAILKKPLMFNYAIQLGWCALYKKTTILDYNYHTCTIRLQGRNSNILIKLKLIGGRAVIGTSHVLHNKSLNISHPRTLMRILYAASSGIRYRLVQKVSDTF